MRAAEMQCERARTLAEIRGREGDLEADVVVSDLLRRLVTAAPPCSWDKTFFTWQSKKEGKGRANIWILELHLAPLDGYVRVIPSFSSPSYVHMRNLAWNLIVSGRRKGRGGETSGAPILSSSHLQTYVSYEAHIFHMPHKD
jgi:hypothetical protein